MVILTMFHVCAYFCLFFWGAHTPRDSDFETGKSNMHKLTFATYLDAIVTLFQVGAAFPQTQT